MIQYVEHDEASDMFDVITDALEAHGDAEGTEAQLDDATDLLRIAFSMLDQDQKRAFMQTAEMQLLLNDDD